MFHVYLQLPLSFNETEDEATFVNEVMKFVRKVREQRETRIYYDGKAIRNLLASAKSNDKNAKQWMQIGLGKNTVNVQDNPRRETAVQYYVWNPERPNETHIAADIVAEACHADSMNCVLDFTNSNDIGRILVFRYAGNKAELPDIFFHIRSVRSIIKWEDIIKKRKEAIPFKLEDNDDFTPTSKDNQGSRIYRQKSTGYFWHLDNFHKNHYEVYDRNGRHLGVADMSGRLDESKKVSGRCIDV